MVTIGLYLINVAILLDYVLCVLTKVGPEGSESGVAIKGCQPHHCVLNEKCYDLGFPGDNDFAIRLVGKQHGSGCLGEAVVQTPPHLLVVVCCLLVFIEPVARMKGSVLALLWPF